MTEAISFAIRTAVQTEPPTVVLLMDIDGDLLRIDLTTVRAVDNLIESLKMARVAAFGLDVPSAHLIGYRGLRA